MNPLLAIICLVAPILLTGLIAYKLNVRQSSLRLILAFSAAYLFAISIMHMLPEAFANTQTRQTGLFIVVGFCIQLLIDTFSTGIEHGHVHVHNHECKKHLPYGIVAGLLLHSFLEGLPVYDFNSEHGTHVNFQLVLGLAVHNLPITITFIALLKEHQSTVKQSVSLVLVFALMSPLGFGASYLLQSFGLNNYQVYGQMAYALVIGIFLHISTAILFETSEHHKYNIAKVVVMSLGILIAYIIS